ncbi:uncharacterized protein LOC126191543 isoform X2 [Schistocerca cancellata]|uniref:uncharacterized protein LOC126191543 isoform X2 n=1 Tax=Schistocerca cancellata TaxID=274614 RepID=UPI002117CD11|nr:uncharacterized protein LOC126191543 isoform X2 [Schistocerca cancellata]XP_049788407.1 uncharacterized protein LOC126191543 isoform X2 [Schistocerca cancellata]XP_049788408.1 uncharacterized protein LOC126191543 isoform X2 [Schistocerca cancellata]
MDRFPLSRETVEAIKTKRQLERAWEEYGDPEDKRALNRQKKLVSRLVAEDRGAHLQALEEQRREAAARRAKADAIRKMVARTDDDTLCELADTMCGVVQMMKSLAVGSKRQLGGGGRVRAIQW